MTKKLKKCYHFMNLRYNANAQQVEARKQMMLDHLQNGKNAKSNLEKIKKVNLCAQAILANIAINGIPNDGILFDTSLENLGSIFSSLLIVGVFAIITFCLMI